MHCAAARVLREGVAAGWGICRRRGGGGQRLGTAAAVCSGVRVALLRCGDGLGRREGGVQPACSGMRPTVRAALRRRCCGVGAVWACGKKGIQPACSSFATALRLQRCGGVGPVGSPGRCGGGVKEAFSGVQRRESSVEAAFQRCGGGVEVALAALQQRQSSSSAVWVAWEQHKSCARATCCCVGAAWGGVKVVWGTVGAA